jgi:serine protease Do
VLGAGLLALLIAAPALASPRWGWFGIRIRELSENEMDDLAVKLGVQEGYGVLVSELLKDAPAESSGLRAGDLIVAIDGRQVVETRTLQRIVGGTPPGRELRVVVLRDGRRRELRVRVGQMPPDATAERVGAEFGFLARERAPGEGPPDAGPAVPVVAAVGERTPAERAGLKVGDRILAVNGTDIASMDAFRRRLGEVSLEQELRLRIQRQGEGRILVLPPAAAPTVTQ